MHWLKCISSCSNFKLHWSHDVEGTVQHGQGQIMSFLVNASPPKLDVYVVTSNFAGA